MNIGIVSDTHLPKRGRQLPITLRTGLQGVDLIIHAGDWSTLGVFEELSEIAPVTGVYGNVDDEYVKSKFPRTLLLEVKGYKIGVVHGDGKGKSTPDRALHTFSEEKVNIIIFGHSHIPYEEKRNGVTLFNPGSPTDKRRQPSFSYGFMQLEEREPVVLHHRFF